MEVNEKRPLMIANGWVQAAGIVLIIGFLIMGILPITPTATSRLSPRP